MLQTPLLVPTYYSLLLPAATVTTLLHLRCTADTCCETSAKLLLNCYFSILQHSAMRYAAMKYVSNVSKNLNYLSKNRKNIGRG